MTDDRKNRLAEIAAELGKRVGLSPNDPEVIRAAERKLLELSAENYGSAKPTTGRPPIECGYSEEQGRVAEEEGRRLGITPPDRSI